MVPQVKLPSQHSGSTSLRSRHTRQSRSMSIYKNATRVNMSAIKQKPDPTLGGLGHVGQILLPTGLLFSDHVPSRELRICAEVGTQQILPSWGRTRNPHHCPVFDHLWDSVSPWLTPTSAPTGNNSGSYSPKSMSFDHATQFPSSEHFLWVRTQVWWVFNAGKSSWLVMFTPVA